ncbi:MAG: helix-turn-helix transcriptional regulator [Candidatus Dormibacteria bacterium]|jgi:transcriptional regulator with XRE-family HTH domain|nr:hypothetical protein [Chloroflexota bacterium]
MAVQITSFSGARLRAMRRAAGLRWEYLAERLGCTYSAVTRWEQGITAPSAVYLAQLCAALRCDVGDLFDTVAVPAVPA